MNARVSTVLLIAALWAGGGAASAQRAAAPYKPPRTADGRPDLQGTWANTSLTVFERPPQLGQRRAFTEDEAELIESRAAAQDPALQGDFTANLGDRARRLARVAGEPRTSFVTSPGNGRIPPKTAGARARPPSRAQRPAGPDMLDNPEALSLDLRCIMPFATVSGPVMLPSLANSHYQIVQTPDAVAIAVEMFHDVRVVRMGAAHGPPQLHPWMGDSIGRWDGDVLVVETSNYHPDQDLFGAQADRLKVTERFSRTGPDRLLYRFTVEDLTTWGQAWGGEYEFARAQAPAFEYACHEGNYTLADLLAGARAKEVAGAN